VAADAERRAQGLQGRRHHTPVLRRAYELIGCISAAAAPGRGAVLRASAILSSAATKCRRTTATTSSPAASGM
jgi:hypothetical protein